jgi:sugar lactone lactonase YvrE
MDKSPANPALPAPVARLVWPLDAELGEGPLWFPGEHALWFVDIEGRRLHRYVPACDQRDSFDMPGRPSFVVPASDGTTLIGMELALHRVRDGVLGECLAEIGGDRHCRTNDATVGPDGRLWFGTMDLGFRAPTGQVHVYDGAAVRAVGGQCPITNGPAISPDGKTLYHVDTLARIVWAFDIGHRDTLVDGRVFARIDAGDGFPDGVCVDGEGGVWVALWGGWSVRRYSAAGDLLARVAIPCAQVTKIAFGGEDLRTAFVTTARMGLSEEELRKQPLAGGLFAFESPVAGLTAHAVTL